jgi:hypothetical protein
MWQGGPWQTSELMSPAIWFLRQWEQLSNGYVPLKYKYFQTAKLIVLEYFYVLSLPLSGKNVLKMSDMCVGARKMKHQRSTKVIL